MSEPYTLSTAAAPVALALATHRFGGPHCSITDTCIHAQAELSLSPTPFLSLAWPDIRL